MCGIAGILRFDGAPASRALVERMTSLIAHRGPDDAGLHVDGPIGLGHRRLSILDLSPAGHQPMPDASGERLIVYNGECYNYRALREGLLARGHALRSTSDTEALLYLYTERGPDFVTELSGMFAFAIWDAPKRRLLLARDRLGIKPLYYFADRDHLVFASELKALLADPSVLREIDDAAMSEYLHLMSIPGTDAILRGVRRLSPGHTLVVEGARLTERSFWEVPARSPRRAGLTLDRAAEELDAALGETVESHLVSDVPVGAFLSGGIDSSAIVAHARARSTAELDSYSITFPGLEAFDEGPFAEQAAAHVGARHHALVLTPDVAAALPKIVWHADEPFAISSALALYRLSERVSREVKVVLTGDGADEIFAGYPWRHADRAARPLRRRVRTALGRLARSALRGAKAGRLDARTVGRAALSGLRDEDRYVRQTAIFAEHELEALLLPERAGAIRRAWSRNVSQRYWDRYDDVTELTRKLYTDLNTTLVSEMLTKVDRMTMAFGLEARVPFLDHRLVELAFTLPDELKVLPGDGKRVLKRSLARRLPASLLERKKHGFNVPLERWFSGELRALVRDLLSTSRVRGRGWFRPEAVQAMLDEHERGARDRSNPIFTLLCFELWLEQYLDAPRRSAP